MRTLDSKFPAAESDLFELTQVIEEKPLHFEACFPDHWQQGRGLFGGLVLACMSRALSNSVESGRTLRSMTAELCGPTQPGQASIEVEVLRAGSQVSTLACKLVQGSNIQAHAVAVFGGARSTDRDGLALSPPTLQNWTEVERVPVEPPLGPSFGQHFEFRLQSGVPFSQSGEASVEGFVWPKNDRHRWNLASIIACADAYWPSTLVNEAQPRPMATIAFTLELCIDPAAVDPAAPLFHRARPVNTRDGYVVEFRELWTPDARLVALNQQTLCIIK
jgi:hypothetical protein